MAGDAPAVRVDTSKIYYATQKEIEAAKERAGRRAALKSEFKKVYTDPMRGVNNGGHIFDPGMQRFMSMRVSKFEHYRFNGRNLWSFLWTTIIPIAAIYKYLRYEKTTNERVFRSGAVPYSERLWKY